MKIEKLYHTEGSVSTTTQNIENDDALIYIQMHAGSIKGSTNWKNIFCLKYFICTVSRCNTEKFQNEYKNKKLDLKLKFVINDEPAMDFGTRSINVSELNDRTLIHWNQTKKQVNL